ncbi:MAG: tape measure protein [Lautropia sp.]
MARGSDRATILINAEDRTRSATEGAKSNVRSLTREIDAFKAQLGTLGKLTAGAFTFDAVASGIRNLVDTRIEFERFQNTLRAGVGEANVAGEMAKVKDIAVGLGLNLSSAAQEYAKFSAATRGTSLEGTQTTEIFTKVAKATAAMGLSAADTSGVLLALTQSISKGKVQAEELRGQLGERLPGAFAIAARSMGVTTSQLDSMLAQGTVLTQDFLPKFAEQLVTELGGGFDKASQGMQAAVNRVETAWTLLKQTLSDSVFSDLAVGSINSVTSALTELDVTIETMKRGGLRDILTSPNVLFSQKDLRFNRELQRSPEKLGEARLRRTEGVPKTVSEADNRALLRQAEAAATSAAVREAQGEYGKLADKFTSAERKAQLLVSQIRSLGIQAGKTKPEIDALVAAALAQQPKSTFAKIEERINQLRDKVTKATKGEKEAGLDDLKRDGATKAQLAVASSLYDEEKAQKAVAEARKASTEVLDKMIQKALEASQATERLQDAMLDKFRSSELELEYYDKGEIALAKRIAQLEAERLQLKLTTEELQAYTDQAGQAAANKRLGGLLKNTSTAKFAAQNEDQKLINERFFQGDSSGQGKGDLLEWAELTKAARVETDDLSDSLKESRDSARELGLTFTSAFEEAVFGAKGLSDALTGLAIDMAKVLVRQNLTKPFLDFFVGISPGGTTQGSGKAGGGPVSAGTTYPVGERGPELFVPKTDGVIVPNQYVGGNRVNVTNNISVGEGADRGMVIAAVKAGQAQTEARILASMRRGGAFSR